MYGIQIVNEPPHHKTNKMTVRPAKTQISLGIRPVWSESSQCAQGLRTQCFFMWTAKTLIRLGGCPGWSESSLGAQSCCWFCHEAAQIWTTTMLLLWWFTPKHAQHTPYAPVICNHGPDPWGRAGNTGENVPRPHSVGWVRVGLFLHQNSGAYSSAGLNTAVQGQIAVFLLTVCPRSVGLLAGIYWKNSQSSRCSPWVCAWGRCYKWMVHYLFTHIYVLLKICLVSDTMTYPGDTVTMPTIRSILSTFGATSGRSGQTRLPILLIQTYPGWGKANSEPR